MAATRAAQPAPDDTEPGVVALDPDTEYGDPVADFVSLWMTLERYHEGEKLTEEAWSFLNEHLQRPIELRLLERQPATLHGAQQALSMATYIMENLDGADPGAEGAWYRRLRLHLVAGAGALIARHAGARRSGSAFHAK